MRHRLFLVMIGLAPWTTFASDTPTRELPDIILVMSDDQGWGDTGYNGHPRLRTPNLDAMAANGLRFERFYAAAPVCSPTRGSCLTGRHPFRYGIRGANSGHLPRSELNLAEALKGLGYRTGHFGKWHLGTLTRKVKDGNRGGRPKHAAHHAPPWEHGFDVSFSAENRIPTWDPMITPARVHGGVSKGQVPGRPFGGRFWTATETYATENVSGCASRMVMDRAIPFITTAVKEKARFFAVIWFHAPHLPVVAGPEDLALYPDGPVRHRHYLGCLTALDRQVGRLRRTLRELGVAENTMLWFCADNGPEGGAKAPGSTKGLRGRKRSLYEGGVRVPGLLEWPRRVPKARVTSVPACTSDYFPTILAAVGLRPHPGVALDGIDLGPLLDGTMTERGRPIGFEHRKQVAWTRDRYKLYRKNEKSPWELYDLVEDPGETNDLAAERPERVEAMRLALEDWRASR